MREGQVLGRHISGFAEVLGFPVAVPDRPPEDDPEYGLTRYVELPERGFAILIDWDDIATCVQFFSGDKDPTYRTYQGALPCGLSFASSRADARRALGAPVRFDDGGRELELLGTRMKPWDWFVYEGRKLHFEYHDDADGIVLVSLALLPES